MLFRSDFAGSAGSVGFADSAGSVDSADFAGSGSAGFVDFAGLIASTVELQVVGFFVVVFVDFGFGFDYYYFLRASTFAVVDDEKHRLGIFSFHLLLVASIVDYSFQ